MTEGTIGQQPIILFDGLCNLCNPSVVFVLQHERQPIFQFASLQSKAGQKLLGWCGLSLDYNQAVILIDKGKIDFGSTAALKIGKTLKFPWWVLSDLGILVPKSIRDWVYHQVAQHRYRWFGKREVCMLPTEELKKRFL